MDFLFEATPASKSKLRALQLILSPKKFRAEIRAVLKKQTKVLETFVSRHTYEGQILRRRTGRLGKSVKATVIKDGPGLPAIKIGSLRGKGKYYGGVQEHGTRRYNPKSPYSPIRPKRAGSLAVATEYYRDERGVPRRTPRRAGKLQFIPIRGNRAVTGVLVRKSAFTKERRAAKRQHRPVSIRNMRPLFLLLKYVNLKPTWWLRKAILKYEPLLGRALEKFLKEYFSLRRLLTR